MAQDGGHKNTLNRNILTDLSLCRAAFGQEIPRSGFFGIWHEGYCNVC